MLRLLCFESSVRTNMLSIYIVKMLETCIILARNLHFKILGIIRFWVGLIIASGLGLFYTIIMHNLHHLESPQAMVCPPHLSLSLMRDSSSPDVSSPVFLKHIHIRQPGAFPTWPALNGLPKYQVARCKLIVPDTKSCQTLSPFSDFFCHFQYIRIFWGLKLGLRSPHAPLTLCSSPWAWSSRLETREI